MMEHGHGGLMKMGLLVLAMIIVAWGVWMALRPTSATTATKERAVAQADIDAFLEPYRDQLRRSLRPAAKIELVAFPQDELVASKLGGRAWWPQGEAPPSDENGKRLGLLAQVNFEEVPTMDGYPSSGLLQFFIAGNDLYGANFEGDISEQELTVQRNFRVVYWPDTSLPATALPVSAGDLLPHDPTKPMRMRFTLGQEPLSLSDHRYDALLGGDSYTAAEAWATRHGLDVDAFVDALWNDYEGNGGHKLGGYPFFSQEDPRRSDRFELLLQLDSDEELMWGDAGVGNFFIAPEDLARADFNNVLYTWDCH